MKQFLFCVTKLCTFWVRNKKKVSYIYCVFHPFCFLFLLQMKLLVYCCESYVAQTVLATDVDDEDDSNNGNHSNNKKPSLPTFLHWWCVILGVFPSVMTSILASLDRQNLALVNKKSQVNAKKEQLKSAVKNTEIEVLIIFCIHKKKSVFVFLVEKGAEKQRDSGRQSQQCGGGHVFGRVYESHWK